MAEILVTAKGQWQISGNVLFSTAIDLFKQSKKFWEDAQEVVIDFSDVDHADSAALALLTEWQRYAKKHDKRLFFKHLPQQLVNLAKISGLNEVLHIS